MQDKLLLAGIISVTLENSGALGEFSNSQRDTQGQRGHCHWDSAGDSYLPVGQVTGRLNQSHSWKQPEKRQREGLSTSQSQGVLAGQASANVLLSRCGVHGKLAPRLEAASRTLKLAVINTVSPQPWRGT